MDEIMNTKKSLVAIAAFAAVASAFAGDVNPFGNSDNFVSTKTRAEVVAELRQAQADHTYVASGREFDAPSIKSVSARTRADVVAELRQAKEDGTYNIGGEAYMGLDFGPGIGVNYARMSSGTKLN
jgi:Domain of unknown function (DUF4148)